MQSNFFWQKVNFRRYEYLNFQVMACKNFVNFKKYCSIFKFGLKRTSQKVKYK